MAHRGPSRGDQIAGRFRAAGPRISVQPRDPRHWFWCPKMIEEQR